MNNTNTTHCLCSLIIGPDATCSIGCEIYRMLSGKIAQNTSPEFYTQSWEQRQEEWKHFDYAFHLYLDHIQQQLEPVDQKSDRDVLVEKLSIVRTSGTADALNTVIGWILEGKQTTGSLLDLIQVMLRALHVTAKEHTDEWQEYIAASDIIRIDANRHACQHDTVRVGLTKSQYTSYILGRRPGDKASTREQDNDSDLELETIYLECLDCGKAEEIHGVSSALSHAVELIEREKSSPEFSKFIDKHLSNYL